MTCAQQERLAAKIKREQMLLNSFSKPEEATGGLDDALLLEFTRRPSQGLMPDGSGRALSRKASQYQRIEVLDKDVLTTATDILVTEGLVRRPSQAAQLQIAERLAISPSPAVRKAAELLLGQEFPEEEVLEAEPSSPKSSLMHQYESALRDGRPPPQTIDMFDEEVDAQTLENPTPPDDTEDEGYDSD